MKGHSALQSLGIRARVLILAMVPLTIVVLLLGYSLASSRLDDARQASAERGQMIARNLALASEFALVSQNRGLLEETLARVAEEPGVRWAAVWDHQRASLVSSGEGPGPERIRRLIETLEAGHEMPRHCHAAPIAVAAPRLHDFGEEWIGVAPDGSGTDSQELGIGLVRLDTAQLDSRSAAIIRNSVVLTVTGLVSSIVLALIIGNSIVHPLLGLRLAVRDLQSGRLSARAEVRAGGEIGALVQGVNQMAENLEHSQGAMQQRVDEATLALRRTVAELEQRNLELEEAREAALRAGRERTEFLARMSHEIRTPLNAVLGFARLLSAAQQTGYNHEHLRTIQTAAEQLLHVINDILQFIRLDAGADQLETAWFDLGEAIEDVVAVLAPMANRKGLELVLLMHSDLPQQMHGDRARLSQVLLNLVNNAIKFTPSGQVVIEASRGHGTDADGTVEITVRDTGIGMDQAQQERLFSPFSQADSSITRRFGGSGLGLSIAQRLVRLMGGEIGAHSVEGQGSRFWVRLPCPPAAAAAPRHPESYLAGQRILVYDANPLVRRSLRSMLAAWGAHVFNTGSWSQVLALLCGHTATTRFDTVILGLSKHECRPQPLAENIRALREHHKGGVLLLTGSEDWVPPDAVRTEPGVDWSIKPVRRSVLRRLLGDHQPVLQSPPDPARGSSGRLHGMQILVAEDNAFNRELLREILQVQGADVDEAVSGDAAIAAAAQGGYDVVLMDLHMPEVDGAEAARRIRAALGSRTPTIWAVTADVFGQTDLDESRGCFDDWLLKPIDPESLVDRLAALRERSAEDPGDTAPTAAAMPAPLPPRLLERYREEVKTLVGTLRGLLEREDRSAAAGALHDLEGMVGLFGGTRRVDIARRLGREFQSGGRTELGALLDELEDCATRPGGGDKVEAV